MASSEFVHFQAWFGDSVVVDSSGWPLKVYHGSTEDILHFDKSKIRLNDLDVPYNGFWFSTDPQTQPAMRAARYTKAYFLSLQNPAPWRAWRSVARKVLNQGCKWPAGARSEGDAVRMLLQEQGYDGVIHEDYPVLDMETFQQTGRVDFEDARGWRHAFVRDDEQELVHLYSVSGGMDHHITAYDNIEEYLSMIQRVYVVFEPWQITRA